MCHQVLLSEELKAAGITVVLLHPGFNKTEMTAKRVWPAVYHP